MAKKKVVKRKPKETTPPTDREKMHVSKQTAGAVAGAVLGGVVGGPIGALAAGALGAMVGDASAKGQKPIKRAVTAIRDEVTSGRAKDALKEVGERIKLAGKSIKTKITDKMSATPAKKKNATSATAKPKKKPAKKKA